jgi:hypothetical protein
MRHYLLTRSAYGPDVPLEVNRRRLDLLRGITARSLAVQTERRLTWLVLIDPGDPLLAERTAALESAGYPLMLAPAPDLVRDHFFDRPQTRVWRQNIVWDGPTLTSRIDDDDALAPFALADLHRRGEQMAGRNSTMRQAFVLALGFRLSGGRFNLRDDPVSQFIGMYARRGDRSCVMDINHTSMRTFARVQLIRDRPAWLWIRHDDARSAQSKASHHEEEKMEPITPDLRAAFDVDWSLLA